MANTTIEPLWVARDVQRVAKNETRFIRNVQKKLSDEFIVSGTKVGGTVGVRLAQRLVTTKGQGIQLQNIQDTVVYVTITDQANIAWGWSSREGTLNIQDTRERYVNPAGTQLANTADKDGLSRLYQDIYFSQGTPGTTPSANTVYFAAADDLTQIAAVPKDSRNMLVNSTMGTAIANANLALFNLGSSKNVLEDGMLSAGALKWKEWWEDNNIYPHTYGTYAGTPLVKGASQTGSTLATDGWSSGASTLNKGDVFTIGSGATAVKGVNVQSYQDSGLPQKFVVTATTSDVSGEMLTLAIAPSIITSGAYQTVVASPADNATINVVGSSAVTSMQGLGYHKDAFVMASADLILPNQGKAERVRAPGSGMSLRLWEASDIMTDQHPTRLDWIYGFKTIRADWAVRIQA